MGKIKGSHRASGRDPEPADRSKRERRNEGPPPTGENVAVRNADRFIRQQTYKRNTGQGESDLFRGTPRR